MKTESEMRDAKELWPKSEKELLKYIRDLVGMEHDYGTCVYAMSLSAVAAFNYIAHKLGVTGFQASCADLDIIRRTRRMKNGFCIVDYENLLYPQYDILDKVRKNLNEAISGNLKKRAAELLSEGRGAHPDVKARWEKIAKGEFSL